LLSVFIDGLFNMKVKEERSGTVSSGERMPNCTLLTVLRGAEEWGNPYRLLDMAIRKNDLVYWLAVYVSKGLLLVVSGDVVLGQFP
jgi:hypothetical protein